MDFSLTRMTSVIIYFFISICIISNIVVEGSDFDYGMLTGADSGIDEWYAEIQAERQRVARQLDYPAASDEEEVEMRSSRSNMSSADSLATILGISGSDEEDDDYVPLVPDNDELDPPPAPSKSKSKSKYISKSSSSSSSESLEQSKGKGNIEPETHAHDVIIEHHLNPEAVEDYHHSDNSHDGQYVVPLNSKTCKGIGDSCTDNHVCCSHYCSWTRGFTCYSVPFMTTF